MTLQASGAFPISAINSEFGRAATTGIDMGWINSLVKPAQRPAQPNMAAYFGMAYYARTNDGNCTVNCAVDCDCGGSDTIDSGSNCIYAGPINCVNCDAQAWLQYNCNCGPGGYNCAWVHTQVNCF
jgi:hypothetical protein